MRLQPKTLRHRQLAAIHIAAGELGLDDAAYRDMLYAVGRVRTAADLDLGGRAAVLEHLRERQRLTARRYYPGRPGNVEARPMLLKIEALLADQHLPWSYAQGIARQMFRRPLQWLQDGELRAVVAALYRRHQGSGGQGRSR